MIASRQLSRFASARPAARSAAQRMLRQQPRRFQSSTPSATGGSSSFATGVVGGLVGAVLAYSVYSFTPAGRTASKINKAAADVNSKYQAAAKKLQDNTPDADQAVDSIKQFAYSYAVWIPGGKGYVDAAFNDWETVRKEHKEEADAIVNDAYKQLREVSKSGLSLETATKAYEVLADVSKKIASLSVDAISDIMDNHPQVKEKFGGSIDKLKDMGKNYGPEAKKQVDETWNQIKDIFSSGISADSLDKARKLIEDKVKQVEKLGDESWKKGLEAAKPYLDKNPKVKELVEKNSDYLKKGNVSELFNKLRSGDGDLQKYVQSTVDSLKSKAKSAGSGSGIESYLGMIPQGGDIMEKLQQIGQVADKHKDEGEKLLKETVEELKRVLEEKSKKGREIVDKAKEEVK